MLMTASGFDSSVFICVYLRFHSDLRVSLYSLRSNSLMLVFARVLASTCLTITAQ